MDHSTVCHLNKNFAIYECSFKNEYFNNLSSIFHGKMTYMCKYANIISSCLLSVFCFKIFHFVYSKCQWIFYRISHEFLVVFFSLIYCSMSSNFTSFKMVKFTSFKNHKIYSVCK